MRRPAERAAGEQQGERQRRQRARHAGAPAARRGGGRTGGGNRLRRTARSLVSGCIAAACISAGASAAPSRRSATRLRRPGGARQQIDQRQQPQAQRQPVGAGHAHRAIDRAGPAAGVRRRQCQVERAAVGAAEAEQPRRPPAFVQRRGARGVPGGGEVARAHRRQRLRRQGDEIDQGAVRAGLHADGAGVRLVVHAPKMDRRRRRRHPAETR